MLRGSIHDLRRARPPATSGLTRLSLCSHPACSMGSSRLAAALGRALEAAGLRVEIPAAPTLCGGSCRGGPYLGLRDRGVFYAGVNAGEAAEVVAESLMGGRLIFPRLILEPYTVTDGRLLYQRRDRVLVLMEPGMCLVGAAAYLVDFHGRESCGKCVPCRLGVRRVWDILRRLEQGGAGDAELEELGAVARLMAAGSFCEFGPKVAAPLLLLWEEAHHLLAEHLKEGCPRSGAPRLGPPGRA